MWGNKKVATNWAPGQGLNFKHDFLRPDTVAMFLAEVPSTGAYTNHVIMSDMGYGTDTMRLQQDMWKKKLASGAAAKLPQQHLRPYTLSA